MKYSILQCTSEQKRFFLFLPWLLTQIEFDLGLGKARPWKDGLLLAEAKEKAGKLNFWTIHTITKISNVSLTPNETCGCSIHFITILVAHQYAKNTTFYILDHLKRTFFHGVWIHLTSIHCKYNTGPEYTFYWRFFSTALPG